MATFKIGDRVTITRKATSEESRGVSWTTDMNKYIGKTHTVTRTGTTYASDIEYAHLDCGWAFPFAVLELFKTKVVFARGAKVRVTRRATDAEMKGVNWNTYMTKAIGGTWTVADFSKYDDFAFVSVNGNEWKFPVEVLELIKEETMSNTGQDLYVKLQAQVGIQVGDIVEIVGAPSDNQFGWNGNEDNDIFENIGEEATVSEITGVYGITILVDGGDDQALELTVPFFCLQKVDKPSTAVVKLSADYDAVVTTREIKVGCQEISFEAFDLLVKAVEKLRSGK